jgi:hypothetical protein
MNRVVLSIFYFVVVLPFGLGVRLFSDPMKIKKKRLSNWTDLTTRTDDLDKARKLF